MTSVGGTRSVQHDIPGILTSVLQEVERLVEVDGGLAWSIRIVADMAKDEAENSAHLNGIAITGWRPMLAMYNHRHILGMKTQERVQDGQA